MAKKPARPRPWKQWLLLPALSAAGLLLASQPASAQAQLPATIRVAPQPPMDAYPNPAPSSRRVEPVIQRPEYPGGHAQLVKDLSAAVDYPALARDEELGGNVYIRFTVGADGLISDVVLAAPLRAPAASPAAVRALENEALRAVRSLKKRWKPSLEGGQPVPMLFSLPVGFRI